MARFLVCSFTPVFLYPIGIDMYLMGLPRIVADLQVSETQLRIVSSVYLAGVMTAMLFVGKIVDQSGCKPVAVVGTLIFIFASALCSFAESGMSSLIDRSIQGIGAGCCYVVAFATLCSTLDDRRRAKILSLSDGTAYVAPVLVPVMGHLIMLKFL